MSRRMCLVVVPSGSRLDADGRSVDFDAVYRDLLEPAIRAAELEPLRGDPGLVGGIIHKPMFERLILADYVVADLTTADANVFYEVGVRHAARPASTLLMSADANHPVPGRVIPYALDDAGRPADASRDRERLVTALRMARDAVPDSPVYQLTGYLLQADLGPLADVETGVLVDLLLAYRATSAWNEMIRLVAAMPAPLARTLLVGQQHGLALNRVGRSADAERVLRTLLEDHGASSETLGLLGRVYKDRWDRERHASASGAQRHLDQAIDAYNRAFEVDWRDAYPGVNAVVLMEIRDPGGEPQRALLPVVRFAASRRVASGYADYWDHVTRLELAVVAREPAEATACAAAALAAVREPWEPASTARQLSLIREARAQRGETVEWADAIEHELNAAARWPSRRGE